LENSGQLDHHRGKAAFDWFMDLARNPQQHPVKIGGEETSVGGSVLVWGSVDEDARPQIMEETGLNEILSLESIVQDLLAWGSSEMEQFISAKHDWLNELFIELNPVGTARFRGLMNGSTSPGSTDTGLAQIDNSDDQPYSTVYGLNSAIDALEIATGLDLPTELFDGWTAEVYRREPYFYFANEFALPDAEKYVFGRGWDDFTSEPTEGYLAFGYFGHGANSWGYCMNAHLPDLILALRLGCGGVYMPEDSFETANGYLAELSQFVVRTRELELSFEAVENMGYGRYRLFDSAGKGIEREISLLTEPNRTGAWNRLLAELGLMEAGGKGKVTGFDASDSIFEEWQMSNPTGSVMVLSGTTMFDRPLIHSPGCPFMHQDLEPGDRVACAAEVRELLDWADQKGELIPSLCSKCFHLQTESDRRSE
jgi:hypothetical protein